MLSLENAIKNIMEEKSISSLDNSTDTLLELLRFSYFETNPIEDTAIRKAWADLDSVFLSLPNDECDALLGLVSRLIEAYSRAYFRHGAILGKQLMDEMK